MLLENHRRDGQGEQRRPNHISSFFGAFQLKKSVSALLRFCKSMLYVLRISAHSYFKISYLYILIIIENVTTFQDIAFCF